jgi:hypothetical protein
MGLLLVALEECSAALVDCLARQDPNYLEHLERRGELIRRLSLCRVPAVRDDVRARLEHCRTLGAQAWDTAARMRASAGRDLAAAGQERRVAAGLRALGGAQNAMLDVKA